MKKVFLSIVFAVAAMANVNAQQISVVAPNGTTTVHTDLNIAIQTATAGSTVYLSGGGFQINDTTKIKKKLTLIGVGHKPNNDNADGNTNVSGNFWFEGSSDGSCVMGLHLSGNVNIGAAENAVNNFLLRYCNANSVQIHNANCQGVKINQNYLRGDTHCRGAAVSFSNNILNAIYAANGGVITNNVILSNIGYNYYNPAELLVRNSTISNNAIYGAASADNCTVNNNIYAGALGDNCKVVTDWESEFEGPNNGVNPTSNFALKAGSQGKNAGTDGKDIGIYGGTGFSDSALPPGPRIVSKRVAEQTDANGNLKVEIKVSAE